MDVLCHRRRNVRAHAPLAHARLLGSGAQEQQEQRKQEQQKQFILTKEPRWLGGALVRYLRDRGELPAEDHDVAKTGPEPRARAVAGRFTKAGR